MRERDDEAMREMATAVFSTLFDRDEVPPNILVRDFGRCVLEIANQRGALPNGIELKRNARDQAREGVEVPLDPNFSQLKKGDLIYFGSRARSG